MKCPAGAGHCSRFRSAGHVKLGFPSRQKAAWRAPPVGDRGLTSQEKVSVINDLNQVFIFEKFSVLGPDASVGALVPLT